MAEIKKEEAAYVPLPKFYTFQVERNGGASYIKTSIYKWGQRCERDDKDVQNKRNAK